MNLFTKRVSVQVAISLVGCSVALPQGRPLDPQLNAPVDTAPDTPANETKTN